MSHSPCKNGGSAGTNPLWPPLPGTGSTITLTVSVGAVCQVAVPLGTARCARAQTRRRLARSAHGLAAHPHIRQRVHSRTDRTRTHHEWKKAISVDGLAFRRRHRAGGPPVVQYQCALYRDNVQQLQLARHALHHLDAATSASEALSPNLCRKIKSRERWSMMGFDGKQPFYDAEVKT